MKKPVTAIVLFDTVFLLLLSVAGSIGGAFGDIAYYFAFIIPLLLAFLYVKSCKYQEEKPIPLKLLPDVKSFSYALPLIVPFIAIVFVVSFLTSLLLTSLGFSEATDVSGNILYVIMKHALFPAIFEEAIFRFIPIMLLLPYSKKNALVISSLLFACVHCNLFQIPYALIASFLLSLIAIATGSIFPCVVVHFLNNLASIFFMRYSDVSHFNLIFFLSLGLLAVISIAIVVIKREKYKKVFAELKADKCNVELTLSSALFISMTLIIGVINLWTSL